MFRPIIFIGFLFIFSCKKNSHDDNDPTTKNQFHKSITAGETYAQMPEIRYLFEGKDESINIIYPEADLLKWVQFNSDKVIFKKTIQPAGGFTGLWSKGFCKTTKGDFVFTGPFWQADLSLGSIYIATVNESGNLVNTKLISLKSGEHLSADNIFPAHDGGYFAYTILNSGFNLTKLNENAEVEWRKENLSIKDIGYVGEIKSLTEDSEGNIIVASILHDMTGTSLGPEESLIKLSPDGDIIWVKSLNIKNMDAHNNNDYNIKYLFTDEENSIYAFEEFHYVKRILITKFDSNGNILLMRYFDDNTTGLYDVQYRDRSFYVLTGCQIPVKTLHFEINSNLEITKKGVVLGVGNLSELPGKFVRSPDDQFTDFILAGKDESDKNAWQHVRLNDNWKYPCYDYTFPNAVLRQYTDFTVRSWNSSETETIDYSSEDFITSDADFELQSHSIGDMHVDTFCRP